MKLPLVAKNVFTENENAFTARHIKMAKKTLTELLPRIPSESELEAYSEVARKKEDARKTISAAIVRRFWLWDRSLSWWVPTPERMQATADYIELCEVIDKANDSFFALYGERVETEERFETEDRVC